MKKKPQNSLLKSNPREHRLNNDHFPISHIHFWIPTSHPLPPHRRRARNKTILHHQDPTKKWLEIAERKLQHACRRVLYSKYWHSVWVNASHIHWAPHPEFYSFEEIIVWLRPWLVVHIFYYFLEKAADENWFVWDLVKMETRKIGNIWVSNGHGLYWTGYIIFPWVLVAKWWFHNVTHSLV